MNILTKTTGARTWLIAAAIGIACVAFDNAASAAEPSDLLVAKVRFADLNLANAVGATTLYGRIRAAAEEVCAPLSGRSVGERPRHYACVQSAIASAVASVDSSELTAVYRAHGGQTEPVQMAAGNR
jgi:UrcA family protein